MTLRAGRSEQGSDGARRKPVDRRKEAHQAGDLERAAELSREPNVHLGPQYRAGYAPYRFHRRG